ncbi:MAG: DsbA family protein [Gemmatimonadota bacterium]
MGYVVNALYPFQRLIAYESAPKAHPIPNWQLVRRSGALVGNANAPVLIAEFSDFECPACAYAHGRLRELQAIFGDTLAISFHYYPLEDIHPNAHTAAMAAECANVQGRFDSMQDLLFAEQDSLGVRPWDILAREAGVADIAEFRRCLTSEAAGRRIRIDQELGKKLGVRATPTLIVQGMMLPPGVLGGDSLPDLIRRSSTLKNR